MKQTITEKDIDKLAGRFILELNSDEPIRLTDKKADLPFYFEKRISILKMELSCLIFMETLLNTQMKHLWRCLIII